jgi:hypothetical protein
MIVPKAIIRLKTDKLSFRITGREINPLKN